MEDERLRSYFRVSYLVIGIATLLTPITAAFLNYVLSPEQRHIVILVETVGIYNFSAFWIVKSIEINLTSIKEPILRLLAEDF